MTDERLHEIIRRLADLGPLDGWGSTIDPETGNLLLQLPRRFLFEDDAIWLGYMETSTAEDHALLEFLGNAPFAIRDLLTEVRRLRDLIGAAMTALDVLRAGLLREGGSHDEH